MRILLATVGSRGDVEPVLALGAGLTASHRVIVATHETFREMVEESGLGFAPLPGDPIQVLRSEIAAPLLTGGAGIVRFSRRFLRVLEPWFEELAAATAPLVAAADLAVYSPLAFTVWHQCHAAGVPPVLASLQPFARTRHFSAVPGGGTDRGTWLNLASHVLAEQVFWQPLRRPVNRWRVTRLGLPPLPVSGPLRRVARSGETQLFAYSPTLAPPPPDWPPSIHVTGAWRRHPAVRLDPTLEDFLAAGPAPLYVGFGSMVDDRPEQLSAAVRTASQSTRMRLVLASGWAELAVDQGDDVLVIGDTDHGALFPRTAAVVHHGGAGTTHSAAAAGVPQVVVPYFADQPFWARRVERLGIGPAAVPRRELTASALTAAIDGARHPAIVERARVIGGRVRSEDGVGEGVRILG